MHKLHLYACYYLVLLFSVSKQLSNQKLCLNSCAAPLSHNKHVIGHEASREPGLEGRGVKMLCGCSRGSSLSLLPGRCSC